MLTMHRIEYSIYDKHEICIVLGYNKIIYLHCLTHRQYNITRTMIAVYMCTFIYIEISYRQGDTDMCIVYTILCELGGCASITVYEIS